VQVKKPVRSRKAPVDETMVAAEAAAFGAGNGGTPKIAMIPKVQQSIMSAFARDTSCIMDERLAKSMKAAKTAAKKKKDESK